MRKRVKLGRSLQRYKQSEPPKDTARFESPADIYRGPAVNKRDGVLGFRAKDIKVLYMYRRCFISD